MRGSRGHGSKWRTPADIKARYPAARFLASNRVVFNVKGNTYRLRRRVPSPMAIFNFPIMRDDHVRRAVRAGVGIQRLCLEDRRLRTSDAEGRDVPIGVGIGIHTGHATIGEVGTAYKDFTIIGPVVNTAARIQASAQLGDILVTEDVYGQVADLFPAAEARAFQLKGIDHPMNAYRLHSP